MTWSCNQWGLDLQGSRPSVEGSGCWSCKRCNRTWVNIYSYSRCCSGLAI